MIPKILHYCWFGKGKQQAIFDECLNSWKLYLPDWQIIEWNEDNFDINSSQYTKFMYENREYAYVSDYVRLYALYTYGGFYLDTDVMLHATLNSLLNNEVILVCEYMTSNYMSNINNAEMASVPRHPLFAQLLSDSDNPSEYDYIHFESLTATIFANCAEYSIGYNDITYLHNGEFLVQTKEKGLYGNHAGNAYWSTDVTYDNYILITSDNSGVPTVLLNTSGKLLKSTLVPRDTIVRSYFIRVLPSTRAVLWVLHPKQLTESILRRFNISKPTFVELDSRYENATIILNN